MMYFSWNPGTVVDEENRPISAGRVTVFVHDSNVLADIYTMEGDQYIPAANPQFLDDYGRLSATLFAELGVYDVKIEKDNGDGTYEDFDHFEIGIDANLSDIGRSEVADLEGLAGLDPDIVSSIVTVTSYPQRSYIWDPNSTDTPDGGVVVDSDVKGEGNWILLWDCPYLPSSVYGVKDGDITNLNALLNYASVVGSFHLHTPPIIRFESGHYNMGGTYLSTKKVAFDPGVSFSGTLMVPSDIELLGKHTAAIGNIYFENPGCTAHSSWYPNVQDFWRCNADIYWIDDTNYFSNTAMTSATLLSNKSVYGRGRIFSTWSSGAYIQFTGCNLLATKFLSPTTDYVKFNSMPWQDSIWTSVGNVANWNFGTIADGHRTEFFQHIGGNEHRLADFSNADIYVAVRMAESDKFRNTYSDVITIDLQGRTVSKFQPGAAFEHIRNMQCTGNTYLSSGNRYDFTNCRLDEVNDDSLSLILTDCAVTFAREPSQHGIVAERCSVTSNYTWNQNHVDLTMRGGRFDVSVNYATDNITASRVLNLTGVYVASTFIYTKKLYMYDCIVRGTQIRIYPYQDGTVRKISGALVDCDIDTQYVIEYTMIRGTDYDCHDIILDYRWERNSFHGNQKGITMPFWSWASGPYRFIAVSADHNVTYLDNTGNCPASHLKGSSIDESAWTEKYNYAMGNSWYARVRTGNGTFRMFPRLSVVPGWGTWGGSTRGTVGSSFEYCTHLDDRTWLFGWCSGFDLKDFEDDPYDFFDFWAIGVSNQGGVGKSIIIV